MRKFLALAMLVAVLITCTACGQTVATTESAAPAENTAADVTGETLEPVDLAISGHPAPHSLPNTVGLAKDWFTANGMNVTNTYYISGLSQMEAAPSGTWECGICGIPPTINGTLNYGVNILGFSIYDDAPQYLFVREDSPIYLSGQGHIDGYPELYGTVDDWRGATILMPKGTTAHVLTLATLDALGLTEDDVNIVHMEVPAAAQAFRSGEGDVMAQWSTFSYAALEEGYKPASTAAAIGLNLPSPILATDAALADNPVGVQRYVNQTVEALQWINDPNNRAEMTEIYMNMAEEEGVAISEEAIEWILDTHHIPTIEELEALCEVDPETGLNGFQTQVATVMDFLIRAGSYDESQKQAVLDRVNTEYMVNAIAAYKAK